MYGSRFDEKTVNCSLTVIKPMSDGPSFSYEKHGG